MQTAIVSYKSGTDYGWISGVDEFYIGQNLPRRVRFNSVASAERAIKLMRGRGFAGKFTIITGIKPYIIRR